MSYVLLIGAMVTLKLAIDGETGPTTQACHIEHDEGTRCRDLRVVLEGLVSWADVTSSLSECITRTRCDGTQFKVVVRYTSITNYTWLTLRDMHHLMEGGYCFIVSSVTR